MKLPASSRKPASTGHADPRPKLPTTDQPKSYCSTALASFGLRIRLPRSSLLAEVSFRTAVRVFLNPRQPERLSLPGPIQQILTLPSELFWNEMRSFSCPRVMRKRLLQIWRKHLKNSSLIPIEGLPLASTLST